MPTQASVKLVLSVYMPTQASVKQVCTDGFNLLQEVICMSQSKGRVVLLGDFNTRGGKSDDVHVYDVII